MDTNEPAVLSDGCVFPRSRADGTWIPAPADTQPAVPGGSGRALSGTALMRTLGPCERGCMLSALASALSSWSPKGGLGGTVSPSMTLDSKVQKGLALGPTPGHVLGFHRLCQANKAPRHCRGSLSCRGQMKKT